MNKNTNENNHTWPPIWGFVVSCLIILLAACGCATMDNHSEGLQDAKKVTDKDTEKEGNMKNSPYVEPYKYIWEPQILQEIIVPGAIRGGVFYPAHKETIIVKPSEPVLRSSEQGTD
jgi:hypothetical protein